MASTKSLEDMLLSPDFDESAVSALVGSLESQLSSDAYYPRTEITSSNSNNNHTTLADCSPRLPDVQKHGALLGSLLEQGSNKNFANSQMLGLNSVPSQNLSNAVIVSLPGALPASGYITQVSSTQQALLNSTVVGRHVSNSDIKLVYSPHSTVSSFTSPICSSVVTSGVITANQLSHNLKGATLHNGSAGTNFCVNSSGQVVTVTSCGPVLSGPQTTGATLSAIHNLANIASQQPRIQVPVNNHQITMPHQNLTVQQMNALNTKNMISRTNQVDQKAKQNIIRSDNSVVEQRHTPSPVLPNHYQVLSAQPSVITTTKPNQVTHISGQPVNVVTQVVTNPNMLPQGVQILNVNPARLGLSGVHQKTLAPRAVVVSNQVRIAPQMIRHGTPIQVPGQGTIALPASMRSALVVRPDGSQYHVFNVAPPGLQQSSASTSNATYRLQSIPQQYSPDPTQYLYFQAGVPASIIRTISPQQVLSVPVSSSAVKTLQAAPPGIVRTLTPQQMASATHVMTSKNQAILSQTPYTVVSTILQQTPNTNTIKSTPSTQSGTTTAAMSPKTIKEKCQNFLSTLIKLAGDQTSKTASNVKKLIQNLIDGTIQPEEFSTQLQKELRSSPQPYLIHFLKKSLPHVRESLMNKEMTIDGIRPPPCTTLQAAISAQIGSIQPSNAPTYRGPVTSQAGSALTAQLAQPPGGTILTQRMLSPQVPRSLANNMRPCVSTSGKMPVMLSSISAASPATVGALQSKVLPPKPGLFIRPPFLKEKEKKTFVSVRDEDDINDVAAMGGVNLIEESQRILASNSELIGTQIRSCKDDTHFLSAALHRKILGIAKKHGLDEVRSDVVDLVSHAAEQKIKALIEKLGIVAEHRVECPKGDPRYEVTQDTRTQIKFLEELDRLEKKRHEEQEREILLKAAKSRSKLEDPEQLKLKQKAKEMQRAEIEEMRQREANMTALLAIGPRKKLKLDPSSSNNQVGTSGLSNSNNTSTKTPVRPRVKRVNLRDLLFVMENEHKMVRRPLLYKYYAR